MTAVLIAEDSLLLREGIAAVLEHEAVRVVAKIDNAAALRPAITATEPDVVIVGIPMPPIGHDEGLSSIEVLKLRHPDVGVLVLSGYFDPTLAVRLVSRRPTSAGYLLKEPIPDMATLVRAVEVVATGGTFVDRAVIERLRASRRPPEPVTCLSAREREILALMAEGRTNCAISDALCLSPKTVESHVRTIFKKLGLRAAADDHRRVLAVLRYLQAGSRGEAGPSAAQSTNGERPAAQAPAL